MAKVTGVHRPSETPRKHKAVRRNVLALLPTLFAILNDLVRHDVGHRDLSETALGLSKGANLPFVDRLLNVRDVLVLKQAPPPQCKQLAWSKCIRHIQLHQKPVA